MQRGHRKVAFWIGVTGMGSIVGPAILEATAIHFPTSPVGRFVAYLHGNSSLDPSSGKAPS